MLSHERFNWCVEVTNWTVTFNFRMSINKHMRTSNSIVHNLFFSSRHEVFRYARSEICDLNSTADCNELSRSEVNLRVTTQKT
jgi:hypothetical protein